MKAKIHPYLVARLIAIQEAFGQPGLRPAFVAGMPAGFDASDDSEGGSTGALRGKGNAWKDILKDDEDDQQGGGRGTMKGLRGKDAEYAKQAMRKLSRGGRR